MRRFLTLVSLFFLAIPAGISISGCTRNPAANYCNGAGYGLKTTDVASITLQPTTIGISIAFGQTRIAGSPQALTCKGAGATSANYTWGTTNSQLVDIAPNGNMCAGTWNRNTGGGIADYTVCSPPNPLPSTNGLPYGIAYITASAGTVTSNPVQVYVHPQVTSVSLVGPQSCLSQGQQANLDAQACYANSSNQQVQLCAPAGVTQCPYAAGDPRCNNPSKYFACPGGLGGVSAVPSCTASIGTLSYSVGVTSIASVATDTTTNQVILTANQPGTSTITASVAGSGSSAGYVSTCPPQSISLALPSGATSGTITQGITQNLVTTVYDTNIAACPPTSANPKGGCLITGLTLDYQSTDPIDISASSSGSITTSFPGVASIYAICQPNTCNPSPINEVGVFGTGLPVSSNPVTIATPGTASDLAWFSAPGQSQYFSPVELLTGASGGLVRLPYVPNSMVMDRLGNNLYFGSAHELMVYSTATNAFSSQYTSVPGVVLAVSPNNSQLLINDQARQVFYLFNVSGGSTATSFGGMGNAAAWTPDSKTLYITDSAALNNATEGIAGHTDTLYIYNANTGWTTEPLPPSPLANSLPPGVLPPNVPLSPLPANVAISSTVQTPALTIPSVGAYLRGSPTEAHTWCPGGTVGNYASMIFYPLGDTVEDETASPALPVQTDSLVATTDGQHILGAAASLNGPGPIALSDINVTIPSLSCLPAETNPNFPLINGDTLSELALTHVLNTTQLSGVNATAVNQVIASPASNLAFVTYTADATNTGATLPFYQPNESSPGTLGTTGYVTLTGSSAITAPLAGAFSPDDKLFFVSTAGDNMIHYISVPLVSTNPTTADTQQISPNLPACTPGTDQGCTYPGSDAIVPATVIVVKARSTT
jgi:hypothetical protein